MATGSALWAKHFLVPQLESVGPGLIVINPRHVELNGSDIRLGSHVHMMATRDRPIRLTVFPQPGGSIDIGDYTIILPGARIASARSIQVGKNCMFATNSYVSDADWHDVYDRTAAPGAIAPIVIEDNVWVGDSAIVCKGVTIATFRRTLSPWATPPRSSKSSIPIARCARAKRSSTASSRTMTTSCRSSAGCSHPTP